MKSTQVEIGSVILRGSGPPPADAANLGRMVQTHLAQLFRRQGAPTESRRAEVVRTKGSVIRHNASGGDSAIAIANAIFRSLKGKA